MIWLAFSWQMNRLHGRSLARNGRLAKEIADRRSSVVGVLAFASVCGRFWGITVVAAV